MSNKLLLLRATDTAMNRVVREEGMITTIHKRFPSGMELAIVVKMPSVERKADLKVCMDELLQCGLQQKAIAFFTDTSTGYISKLLRNKN